MEYCNECCNLSVTEKEQKDVSVVHWCYAYRKQVFHGKYHPLLPRLNGCDKYREPEEVLETDENQTNNKDILGVQPYYFVRDALIPVRRKV